jgi:protein arginine kinase activator
MRELIKSGRPGCAKCYEIFESELDKIITGIHGSARYSGALPGKNAAGAERRKRIEELKKEQQIAINEQNYERAAEIRDEIKALEAKGDE